MFVPINWSSWFHQTSWSVGPCSRCRCTEAIRIGHVLGKKSLYFVTVDRSDVQEIGLCDYCGTRTQPYPNARVVPADKWRIADGLENLIANCAPKYQSRAQRLTTVAEMDELLRNVTRATKFSNIDLSKKWFPPLLGAAIGMMLAFGFVSVMPEDDQARSMFLGLLSGVLAGGILGFLIGGVLTCREQAREQVAYCSLKYCLDAAQLKDVATHYPGRIRSAVRALGR